MIIERYLIREIFQALLGISLVLMLIIFGNQFIKTLELVMAGRLVADLLFKSLFLSIINNLSLIIPFSFYLATLLGLSRLYKDSEVTAMSACGITPARMLGAVFFIGLAIALFMLYLSLYLAPWAERENALIQEESKANTDVSSLVAGDFTIRNKGDNTIYVGSTSPDGSLLENVFIRSRSNSKRPASVIIAKRGFTYQDDQDGLRYIVLESGTRYVGKAGHRDYQIVHFDRYTMHLKGAHVVLQGWRPHSEKPSILLLNSKDPYDVAELHWRLAMPIVTVMLGLFAIPLSKTSPRQGRYARLFTAIFIFAIYVNLLGMAKVGIEKGKVPMEWGMWWLHLSTLLLILGMILKQTGLRWRFQIKRIRLASHGKLDNEGKSLR